MEKNVYWFNEISAKDVGLVGGKGANLGEMANNGFPIPDGFCVTAPAYFDFIRSAALEPLIHEKLDSLDVQDTQALSQASEDIKNAILAAQMPNDIRADVVKAYNRLCGVDLLPSASQEVFVAVRSSATAEDAPDASFAGQQSTFLNVKGADEVVLAVKKCWASLYEARAIYYRTQNKYDHFKVGLSAVVQLMVESETAGVMFTVDPVSNDEGRIIIEGAFGLGEAVVSGAVTPDRYVVEKASGRLVDKNINGQEFMIIRAEKGNKEVPVPEEIREHQKVPDEIVLRIAEWGKRIEAHYQFPQDIEWAVTGEDIFIVQSRPVTTLKRTASSPQTPGASAPVEIVEPSTPTSSSSLFSPSSPSPIEDTEEMMPARPSPSNDSPEPSMPPTVHVVSAKGSGSASAPAQVGEQAVLLKGLSASPGIASGPVRIVLDLKELYKVRQGDVLVTTMTTPDFVPAMKRACAIVTDEGGSTAHAAIVSRELGIPCIVGTRTATHTLSENQLITVDAKRGIVYEGRLSLQEAKSPAQEVADRVVSASPIITGTKIYVNLAEPDAAEKVAAQNVDGVGLLRAEFMIAGMGVHPRKAIADGKQQEFIDALARGLRTFCAAFHPRPVIYRATDFKTNEYRSLPGGEEFEPKEENPMIGYRGCFRYIKDPESFRLELEAIKKVREGYGMKNLWLMIPVVRTVREFKIVRELVEESGLHRSKDFKLGIMCEVPSTVILAEEFCLAGADFFSIGSNDLTQLTLGIDRDNPIVAEEFDERDEAIYTSIKRVIDSCHKHGVPVSICGQAPSVYKEFAEKLVEFGIDSISCNPDVIEETRKSVAAAEQRVLLNSARRESRG